MEATSSLGGTSNQGAVQQNAPASWVTWHSQADNELRSQIIRHVYTIFSQRKPEYQGHAQKISEFSKRVEEMLYKSAKSREEYARLDTVEVRIKELLKSYMMLNGARQAVSVQQQQHAAAVMAQHQKLPDPAATEAVAPSTGGNQVQQTSPVVTQLVPLSSGPAVLAASEPPTSAVATPPPAPAGQEPKDPNTAVVAPPAAGAALLPNGSLAVAGAPAGNSTGDSSMKTGGNGSASEAQQQVANLLATSAPGISSGAAGPAFMSNGAPVLLRGGPVTSGQVPQMMAMAAGPQAGAPAFPMAATAGVPQAAYMNMNGQIMVGAGNAQPLPAFQAVFGQQPVAGQQQQQPAMMKMEGGGMVPIMAGPSGMVPMSGMIPMVATADPNAQALAASQQMYAFSQSFGSGGGAVMAMPQQQQQASTAQFVPLLGDCVPVGSEREGSLANLIGSRSGLEGGDVAMSGDGGGASNAKYEARKQQILKQQRWLLFLRHCAKCQVPESECQYGGNCTVAKQLWQHLINCKEPNCNYPRCTPSRELLKHHQKCSSAQCPVCAPVKQYVSKQRQLLLQRKFNNVNALPPEQRQHIIMQAQQKRLLAQQQGVHSSDGTIVVQQQGVDPSANAPIIENLGGPVKRPRQLLQENMGTSLAEYFDEHCIETHLSLLRLEAANNPPPRRPAAAIGDFMVEEESSCKVCGLNRMTFEPPLLYCYSCGQRIKRGQTYHCTPSKAEVRGHWCYPCVTAIPGSSMALDTFTIAKSALEKKKNDDEVEESWVQCDRCEGWVHQICGLFNKGRNDESKGYLCPLCLLHGLQGKKRKMVTERPQAWLTARDLPRCELSDFLEQRLSQVLAHERQLRASALGKLPHQVPTAEGLTVRVVNNVIKKCEVRSRFLEAFGPDGYPDAFMYSQKVVLLFQQLDGVDMCLFCLYLQEYGEDAPYPNKRTIYLSYLDSVKYFQPENVEGAGRHIRLRTLVYHELLSGYLQYAKQRGFTSMYIWACPPLQGDDYIMYCHPGRQKTPSSKILREWYLIMLRQAKEEGTVVHLSNLFDTFFEDGRDHWLERPTIKNLPYLEGDYWPGEAENLLANLNDEPKANGKGKGANKGRKLAKDKRLRPHDGTTDGQLMARLGAAIQGIREDFIVVHLYENCSCCRQYISGANRYYHPSPPSKVTVRTERTFDGISLDKPGADGSRTVALVRFQLCQSCYDKESGAVAGTSLPQGLPNGIQLTDLVAEFCPEIPATSDSVPVIENEFFDTRNAFLSLCQGNHFQFDTLRRARHSSMMVLYHLHNPSEPAFSCSCNICNREIGPHDGGYRCQTCPDFDMCANCHANPNVTHPHLLQPHKEQRFDETSMRLTDAQRDERAQQLQRTMQLLVHASACHGNCPSTNCAKVKALFNHAFTCKVKIGGGCAYCRRMWALLQAHAKMCTKSDCPVPRCRELRSLRRQQATRQEDKRRAAYRKMLQAQADGSGVKQQ